MAVSGIDHTIKIFSPDLRDQYNARKGIGVQSADSSGFSSLRWDRWRRGQDAAAGEGEGDGEREEGDGVSGSDSESAAPHGLRSRKRMHQAYQITSKNDMDLRGGRDDYFISVCAARGNGGAEHVLTNSTAGRVCAAGATHCEHPGRRGWRGDGADCGERGELQRHVEGQRITLERVQALDSSEQKKRPMHWVWLWLCIKCARQ
jgi:hypothetical protein